MRAPPALLVASLVVFGASSARALPIPGLFDTGVDGTGAALASAAVDPHYVLISSADSNYPGPSAIVASVIPAAYWMANTPTSRWIAPAADENYPAMGTAHAEGDYVYRLSFDLTGFVPGSVQVTGGYAVDNAGAVLINGVTVGPGASYGSLSPFTISSGFVAGINHLDFVVTNLAAGGANPTGLRVGGLQGTGTATAAVNDGRSTSALQLLMPAPNPARSLSRLGFILPRASHVRLKVLDTGGRLVRTLLDGPCSAGPNEAVWAGVDDRGVGVAAGVYHVILDAGEQHASRRMVWMR
jgi:hypothetical protein